MLPIVVCLCNHYLHYLPYYMGQFKLPHLGPHPRFPNRCVLQNGGLHHMKKLFCLTFAIRLIHTHRRTQCLIRPRALVVGKNWAMWYEGYTVLYTSSIRLSARKFHVT